jgi:hypothetical protein
MAYNSSTWPPQSKRADFSAVIELLDQNNLPIDLTGAGLLVQVNPQIPGYGNTAHPTGGQPSAYLAGSLDDGVLMVVGPGAFSIYFAASRLSGLVPGSYDIGLTATRDGMTEQLSIGTVAFYEGVVGGVS